MTVSQKKENGCDTDTLTNSWRSLPDIVDVNNAVFEKTFAGVLDKENIHLEKVRENKDNENSLRYFKSIKDKDSGKDIGVAEHIMKLLNDGAEPNQIAVLARYNKSFDSIADGLNKWGIPSTKGDSHVKDSKVYSLVSSILRIVDSDKDALSKAIVAYLTESDYNTRRIIEEKILNDADEAAKSSDYLSKVPLISQLLKIRPRMQHLSMASLVESVIVELNLYDVVKRIESDAAYGKSCLNTIISSARSYEDHCVQMNLSATVEGFLSYMDVLNPSCEGVPNGVQLHTYHSCKGLQWKYVILTSLNYNVEDKDQFVRRNIYGVSALHAEFPTAENPFPEVYIRLLPWIFGAVNANVPDVILANILADTGCMSEYHSMIAENNRILYVGMTRPSDVLVLNIEEPKKGKTLLKWPKDVGLETVAAGVPDSGDCDIFGTGHSFKNFTLTDSESAALEPFDKVDPALTMPLDISEPSFTKRDPRSLSPSKIRTKGDVESHHNLGDRIPLSSTNSEDMATVGNCIHQIFAGIEPDGHIEGIGLDDLIRSYGLHGVDSAAVVEAWKNLVNYLIEKHGEAVEIFHERPFRLERDGQIFVGSIDLVWKTDAGDVLVDFKTCPMGRAAVLNPDSDHYAGWYAGQLDAYEDALTAAGEKVCARYIYYPVSGLLAAVSRGLNI